MATDMSRQKPPAPKPGKKRTGPKGRTWMGKPVTRAQFQTYTAHAAGKPVCVPDGKYCLSCERVAGRLHKRDCEDPCALGDY